MSCAWKLTLFLIVSGQGRAEILVKTSYKPLSKKWRPVDSGRCGDRNLPFGADRYVSYASLLLPPDEIPIP